MSAVVNWHVNCDGDRLPGGRAEGAVFSEHGTVLREGCPWWHDNGDSRTAAGARRAAKASGWVRVRVAGELLDLCPGCDQKRRQEGA